MQHLDNHKRFKQCLAAGMKPTLVLGKPLSRAAAVPHPHTFAIVLTLPPQPPDPRKQRPANRAKQAAFRRRINEKLQRRGSVAHARRRAAVAAARFEAPRDVDSASSSSSSSSASTSDSASIRSVATTPTHSMAGSTDDSDANSAFTSATSVASSTSTATLASTAPVFDLQQTPAWWAIDEPQPMAASAAAAATAPKAHTPSAAAVAAAAAAGFHTRGHDPFASFAAYTYTPRAVSTVARFDANSAAALSSSPAPGLTDAIVNTTATASCSTPSATAATAATATSCSSDPAPSADHWLSAIELETEAIDSEFSDIIETLARDYAGASATALEFLFPMA